MSISSEEFKNKLGSLMSAFSSSGVLLNDAADREQINVCVLIPEPCVSIFIGVGGANVSETKAATGCDISFSKFNTSDKSLRKAFHKGTIASVAQAVFVAATFIQESGHANTGLAFVVKTEASGAVIGKGGANLKSIREVTGCNTNFEKPEEMNPTSGGRKLTFRHPQEGQALQLTQAVYMAMRLTGFSSPSQNECRLAAAGPIAPAAGQFMGEYGAPQQQQQFGGYGAMAPNGQQQQQQRFSPYGGRPDRTGAGGGVSPVCAIHGKKRGANNLVPHPVNPKLMICQDHDQCKGADPNVSASICATHGKKRGAQNLHNVNGAFVCSEQDQCK